MQVESAAPVVALGDPGGGQVAVEDPQESRRDIEDQGIGRKPHRDRIPVGTSHQLECSEFVGKPRLQVSRQVDPNYDAIAFPTLLVVRVEFDVRHGNVGLELSDG